MPAENWHVSVLKQVNVSIPTGNFHEKIQIRFEMLTEKEILLNDPNMMMIFSGQKLQRKGREKNDPIWILGGF